MTEVNLILKNYDFNIKEIVELNKGFASKKYKIVDKNNNVYILKKIDKQNLQRLNFILGVQSELSDCSPKIITTKENLLYFLENDCIYYLYKFLEGNPPKINLESLTEIGRFLSMLHNKMKKIEKEKSTFLKVQDNFETLMEYLNYYISKDDKDYVGIIDYKVSILKKLKEHDINFKNLNEQIIHGDFYKDNILFDGREYKIIDFDQCCYFYKEYEFFRAMFMMCLTEDLDKKTILKNMKYFIKGYYEQNSINSPIDAYNLYLYIQANSLSSIKPSDRNNIEKNKFAIKRYKILKFLYENKNEILEVLGGNDYEETNTGFSIAI